MSESEPKAKIEREPNDPLGYLIIPIFGVILVAVVLLWINRKKEEDGERYFPVTGKITVNNKPLVGNFQINFYPSEDSENLIASGKIESDGTYELYSGRDGIKGALPGEYRVSVIMLEENDESWRIERSTLGNVDVNPKDGGTVVPDDPDPPFDKQFSDYKRTPQRAVVGESSNRIDIDLPPPQKSAKRKKGTKKADSQPKPSDIRKETDTQTGTGDSESQGSAAEKNRPTKNQ